MLLERTRTRSIHPPCFQHRTTDEQQYILKCISHNEGVRGESFGELELLLEAADHVPVEPDLERRRERCLGVQPRLLIPLQAVRRIQDPCAELGNDRI